MPCNRERLRILAQGVVHEGDRGVADLRRLKIALNEGDDDLLRVRSSMSMNSAHGLLAPGPRSFISLSSSGFPFTSASDGAEELVAAPPSGASGEPARLHEAEGRRWRE